MLHAKSNICTKIFLLSNSHRNTICEKSKTAWKVYKILLFSVFAILDIIIIINNYDQQILKLYSSKWYIFLYMIFYT